MKTCKICLNDRPNEKYSGYGYKIGVCKKCIKKPDRDILLEKLRISDMVIDGRKISKRTKQNLRHIKRTHENEVIRTHAAVVLYTAEIDDYVRCVNAHCYYYYGINLEALEELRRQMKTFSEVVNKIYTSKHLTDEVLLFYIYHANETIAHLAYTTFEELGDIEVDEAYKYIYGKPYKTCENEFELW